jgi:hypothetical protein
MEPIRIDKYTVLNIEESEQYGVKIVEGWQNQAGEFKVNFCKREFGKAGAKTEKTIPVSVKLGDRTMAVSVCLQILRELTGVDWVKEEAPF